MRQISYEIIHHKIVYDFCSSVKNCSNCLTDGVSSPVNCDCCPFLCLDVQNINQDSFELNFENCHESFLAIAKEYGYSYCFSPNEDNCEKVQFYFPKKSKYVEIRSSFLDGIVSFTARETGKSADEYSLITTMDVVSKIVTYSDEDAKSDHYAQAIITDTFLLYPGVIEKSIYDYTNEELCDLVVKCSKDSLERKAIDKEMACRFYRYCIRSMIPADETRPGKKS